MCEPDEHGFFRARACSASSAHFVSPSMIARILKSTETGNRLRSCSRKSQTGCRRLGCPGRAPPLANALGRSCSFPFPVVSCHCSGFGSRSIRYRASRWVAQELDSSRLGEHAREFVRHGGSLARREESIERSAGGGNAMRNGVLHGFPWIFGHEVVGRAVVYRTGKAGFPPGPWLSASTTNAPAFAW